jgi:hypothetical protein
MASARLEKLKSLLKRVEERRSKPRLHAVAAPRPAAAARAPFEELASAPAPEPVRPAAASPLEDALGDFGADAQIEVRPLAEPITTPKSAPRTPPVEPAFAREPEPAVTYRPPGSIPAARPPSPVAPVAPVVPLQATSPTPTVSPKVTLEFGMPRVELPAPAADLSAPTQTIEPAPLPAGTPPARAVSAARVDTPKSFGELLELSLSLRPR